MMRGVLLIAGHDLRLTLRDRGALLWMLILPIVFSVFLGLAMGGLSSGPHDSRARLSVIDHDGGAAAKALIAGLASERLILVEIPADGTSSEESQPIERVRTLIIPEGFTAAVLAGEQVTLRLEKDPDTSAQAAMVAQARVYAAIARLTGTLVEASARLEDDEVLSADALHTSPGVEDLVHVEARFAGSASKVPDGFSQSIPGNLVMFVLLVALTGGAAGLAAERRGGQLRRLVTAPLLPQQIVLGKILGRLTVAASQATVLVLVGTLTEHTLGVGIGDRPISVLVVVLVFSAVAAPLAVAFGAWLRDPERAGSLGAVVTMIMASLGGCWWPIEIVGKPLQVLALAFPTGWAMKALHGIISYGSNLAGVAVPIAVLLGFAAALTLLAMHSLRIE